MLFSLSFVNIFVVVCVDYVANQQFYCAIVRITFYVFMCYRGKTMFPFKVPLFANHCSCCVACIEWLWIRIARSYHQLMSGKIQRPSLMLWEKCLQRKLQTLSWKPGKEVAVKKYRAVLLDFLFHTEEESCVHCSWERDVHGWWMGKLGGILKLNWNYLHANNF